ncbi:uncharacterized protein [Dendropsophus ebraccatus]|uniref:uncharacterized protein isoform X1 n=1 Tax=Dendropsophus ebraccatus TaxID=150705 RepID=UPI003831F650
MSDDQLLQLLTARLQSADEEFLGRLRTALSPPATSAAVAPNEAPPARRSQRIRNRSGSSSSSHDSPGHSRHGRHRRHSRRCSRSSRCSRRSRSSRWRSPSTSEWSSGESGRRSIRMRPEPPPSRSLSLVHCEVPPVVVPPPPPTIPSGLGVSVPPARGGRPWPFMPGSHLGHSGQQLMALISSSVTPPTWQRHGKAWEDWVRLAVSRDVSSSAEVRLHVTIDFLLQLRDKGVSSIVAQRSLSGVAFFLKLNGWEDSTKHFAIRQALKGWKKHHIRKESRRPVSYSLLNKLVSACPSVCSSPYESTLFSACFCTAFFGALRVGELLPPSKHKPGGLLYEDVVVANDVLRIRVRSSKTDQFGRGAWLPIRQVQGSLCPVQQVSDYLALRPAGSHFFVHVDSTPVTQFQFLSVFRRCLSAVGAPPDQFATHSFRIGAATEAARAGLSEAEVQRIGRWRSACFAGYIRPDLLL